MTFQIQTKQFLAAAALAGAAVVSHSALADTIDVTYTGSANFGAGNVGYAGGSIAPAPGSTSLTGVGIGGDSDTTANTSYAFSSTGQMNAWCVDIYHWLAGGTQTYTVATGADLAADLSALRPGTPDGATRVNDLVTLANEVYAGLTTQTDSAAFQLAVWAITYGDVNGGTFAISSDSTANPDFYVDAATASSAYGNLANSWLANLGTAPITGNYALTYLNDGQRAVTQDLVVFTNVPEPASLALLGIGLLGLGLGRRRTA